MPLDPDLIRVDLLKLKRKLYNSYAEGSEERKTFLLASKLSEIGYLSKVVPPDVVNLVFNEYKSKKRQNLFDLIVNLSLAGGWGLLLYGLHSVSPNNIVLSFWYIPSGLFVINAGRYVWQLVDSWWVMRDFKKEYNLIKDQIKKLSDEVKRIGDGK